MDDMKIESYTQARHDGSFKDDDEEQEIISYDIYLDPCSWGPISKTDPAFNL